MWQSSSAPSSPSALSLSRKVKMRSLQVSPEAPSSFQSPLAQVRPAPASRKLKSRFRYEDSSDSLLDFSSIRPKQFHDILVGKNASAKYRLPFYRAYYAAMHKRIFGIQQGFCARAANGRRGVILRDEAQFLEKLKRSSSNSVSHFKVKAEKNFFETSVAFPHGDSSARLPILKSVRLRRSKPPSNYFSDDDPLRLMSDIAAFEKRLRDAR